MFAQWNLLAVQLPEQPELVEELVELVCQLCAPKPHLCARRLCGWQVWCQQMSHLSAPAVLQDCSSVEHAANNWVILVQYWLRMLVALLAHLIMNYFR
jgi:hypothetical protein